MDLQNKLIKALEETIKLQKEVIEQKEERIRALELEKSMKQWYPIQEPYKSPPQPTWPLLNPDPNLPYDTFWSFDSTKWPNDFTVYGMTDEKETQTQKGAGS